MRKGTPFYATYKYRPLGGDVQELTPLLSVARRGPTWTTLDPGQAAERLGMERRDVTRLLERHAETGRIELVPSDLRDRYRVLVDPAEAGRLADILTTRFRDGEARELGRLQVVLEFADSFECRWRVLCRYFGEELGGPCGHCDVCRGRSQGPLP